MNSRIGVIVPSYNQGEHLAVLLSHLRRVRPGFGELVIMDGGSTDCSIDVISKNLDIITYWRSEKDGGQASAVNEGIRRFSSSIEIIVWINSDDGVAEGIFDLIHSCAGEDWDILTGASFMVDATGGIVKYYPGIRRVDLRLWAKGASLFAQPSTFIRRKAWERLGGLREDLRFSLDYDFFIRAIAAGAKIKLCPARPLGILRFYEGIKSFDRQFVKEIDSTGRAHFGVKYMQGRTHFRRFGFKMVALYGFVPVFCLMFAKVFSRKARPFPGYSPSSDVYKYFPVEFCLKK